MSRNYKIAICSLSCAGKTTLIQKLQSFHNTTFQIRHIEGSATLKKFANVSSTKDLQCLDSHSLRKAREDSLSYIASLDSNKPTIFIVDGHYSFLQKNGVFDIAMSDKDFKIYDAVLFLDTDIHTLYTRIRQRDGVHIDKESLQSWYEFELLGLYTQCKKHNTLFSVINDNALLVLAFIESLATQDSYLLPEKVFQRFYTQHCEQLHKHKRVFLIDCDGTMTEYDSVKEFYKHKEVQDYIIPNAFHNHRFYGLYQFFSLTQKRLEIPESVFMTICQKTYPILTLYPKFIDFLCKQEASIIAITAGIRPIYHYLFTQHNIPFLLAANDRVSIISQETKAYFAKALQTLGFETIAIGNGIIDIDMLCNANQGFLIDSSDRAKIERFFMFHKDRQKEFKNIQIINANTEIPNIR